MRKIILGIILSFSMVQDELSANNTQTKHLLLGDILLSSFLLISSSWLIHKQLPRLAGHKVEFDAPVFTKVVASIFALVGATGGSTGAYRLALVIREKLNEKFINKRI